MNCRDCMNQLSQHRDGRLDDSQRDAMDQHLASCASCQRAARMMRATGEVMAAVGPAEPAPDLAARAARAALTADVADESSALWRWWLRVAAPATALGAAAALVLVLVGGAPKAQPVESAPDDDPIGLVSDLDDGDLDATMLAMESER